MKQHTSGTIKVSVDVQYVFTACTMIQVLHPSVSKSDDHHGVDDVLKLVFYNRYVNVASH